MNLLAFQSENYKKIITAALIISIAMSLIPLRPAKAIPVKEVFDWIYTIIQSFWDKYLKQVWKQLQDIVLETLKQQLLGKMIQDTLRWIGGGGKPLFITNWKGFVNKAALETRNKAIREIKRFASVCLPWKAQFNALLDLRYNIGPIKSLQCPSPLINNPLFFTDFKIGGWPGYLDVFMPAGDLYASANAAADIIEGEAAAAAEASKNEALAGKGFASAKKCVTTPEGEKCDEVKTPGANISDQASNMMKSPVDFITNSTNKQIVQALTFLLLQMTLQRLITRGLGA